jgi:hypothetical protein
MHAPRAHRQIAVGGRPTAGSARYQAENEAALAIANAHRLPDRAPSSERRAAVTWIAVRPPWAATSAGVEVAESARRYPRLRQPRSQRPATERQGPRAQARPCADCVASCGLRAPQEHDVPRYQADATTDRQLGAGRARSPEPEQALHEPHARMHSDPLWCGSDEPLDAAQVAKVLVGIEDDGVDQYTVE